MKVSLDNQKLRISVVRYIRELEIEGLSTSPLAILYDRCRRYYIEKYQIGGITLYLNFSYDEIPTILLSSMFFTHVEFPSEEFYTNFLLRYS